MTIHSSTRRGLLLASVLPALGACSRRSSEEHAVESLVPRDQTGQHWTATTVVGEDFVAEDVTVEETGDEVRVHWRVTTKPGTYSAIGIERRHVVDLAAPLGNRRVVDGRGTPVPRVERLR